MVRLSWILLSIGLLVSCGQNRGPDVSGIEVDFKIFRTEKDVSNVHSRDDFEQVYAAHPAFYQIFFNNITGIYTGSNIDSMYMNLPYLLKDSVFIAVNEEIGKKYGDMSEIEQDLKSLFQHFQYYFPGMVQVPNVYTLNSDFSYQTFIFEDESHRDAIGLGLDMFLYPDLPYKMMFPDNTNFSDYLARTWTKENIVKKVADLYLNEIMGEAPGHRLLDYMIYHGKNLYITSLLLPEKHDSIIHEYTGEQMAWCYENELQMWSFFMNEKMFYESNFKKIGKYVFPAPKSPDMPDAAPGRTANFIGWQIVKAYMERYPATSLQSLIQMTDSQLFLEQSKYKPKKK